MISHDMDLFLKWGVQNLRAVVDKSDSCLLLQAPNPYESIRLIQKLLSL